MATPLSALTDAERQQAAARFEILRPFLHQRVALTHVARQHDLKPPSYGLVYAIVHALSPALTTLAAYVGESVILCYDPRDMAEVRVFYHDHFLCRAICQELVGATVPLREIMQATNRHRRDLRQTLREREQVVESLLAAHRGCTGAVAASAGTAAAPASQSPRLKRYVNE
jgi:putative transposase